MAGAIEADLVSLWTDFSVKKRVQDFSENSAKFWRNSQEDEIAGWRWGKLNTNLLATSTTGIHPFLTSPQHATPKNSSVPTVRRTATSSLGEGAPLQPFLCPVFT